MEIKVCIGSACHLKGSYEVIKKCQSYIDRHELSQLIELKSAFCLGKCSEAVSVQVDNLEIYSLAPDCVDDFMEKMHKKVSL